MSSAKLDQVNLYSGLKAACSSIQVEREGELIQVLGKFLCPLDYPGFSGHFPQMPVLPAICQLMAVRLVAEKGLGLALMPRGVKRVKLKKKVGPEETFLVQVGLLAEGMQWQADFSIKVDGKAAASGSLLLAPEGRGEER